jgi:hypothetical protein
VFAGDVGQDVRTTEAMRRIVPLPILFLALFVLFALATGGAIAFENQDANCASCHTEPESSFVRRSTASQAVDLASAHAHGGMTDKSGQGAPYARCIDCHAGPGPLGRVLSLTLGAGNLFRHVTNTARRPSVTTVPLSDANCEQCHADILQAQGFDGHVHRFLPHWRTKDAAAATCVSCHSAHTTDGTADAGFLPQSRALQRCDACHLALNIRR